MKKMNLKLQNIQTQTLIFSIFLRIGRLQIELQHPKTNFVSRTRLFSVIPSFPGCGQISAIPHHSQ